MGNLVKPLEIQFENASTNELDEILSLINKLNQEWFKPIIPEEYYKEPFLTREQIEKMSEIMEFYVHKQEGNIIAVGSFGTRNENTAWIPLMHVRTDYHRKGIGSALMAYLESKARALNFERIHIETDSEAEWAIRFYKNHGYSIIKRNETPWGYHVWLEKSLKNK